jgi:hypothetical protein
VLGPLQTYQSGVCRAPGVGPVAAQNDGESVLTKPRRVIAKVEWHPGELYPRVGFIVTNMSRPRRAGRRVLQQARDVRAVDQGR